MPRRACRTGMVEFLPRSQQAPPPTAPVNRGMETIAGKKNRAADGNEREDGGIHRPLLVVHLVEKGEQIIDGFV
jgi:hypothetical protein